MKNYLHGNTNNRIFKVAFVGNGQLVSGGKGGCTRVYDVQIGQLLQMLEHDKGESSFWFAFHGLYSFLHFAPDGKIVQAVAVRCYAVLGFIHQ